MASTNDQSLRLVVAVEMLLTSAPLRVTSYALNLNYGGMEWLGLGALGQIQSIDDGSGDAQQLQFTLAGVQQDQIALALSENVRFRPVRVFRWLLSNESDAVVDSKQVWAGQLDRLALVDSPAVDGQPGSTTIHVTAEHIEAKLQRLRLSRYTDEEQQKLHPGDTVLKNIAADSGKNIVWPAASWGRR